VASDDRYVRASVARKRRSRTALKIARFIVLLDAERRLAPVLPPDTGPLTEAILRGSGAVPAWKVDMMRARWAHWLYRGTEALTGRGQVLWFGLRKRWISERVDAAIAGGARQLLVIGAGFDPLAARVARRDPWVVAVETDTEPTADAKRNGLRSAGRLGSNLHVLAAARAEQSLVGILEATPWRRDVVSVIVAEGLLMYLTPAEVERFFTNVHDCAAPGSTMLCTSVYTHADGSPRVAAGVLDRPIRLALRLAGEPMRLGLDPRDAPAFFEGHGALVREQPTVGDLRERYLAPIGLAEEPVTAYEHLIEAELRPVKA
jgi:methyltransferase (TIGR00027 family)